MHSAKIRQKRMDPIALAKPNSVAELCRTGCKRECTVGGVLTGSGIRNLKWGRLEMKDCPESHKDHIEHVYLSQWVFIWGAMLGRSNILFFWAWLFWEPQLGSCFYWGRICCLAQFHLVGCTYLASSFWVADLSTRWTNKYALPRKNTSNTF